MAAKKKKVSKKPAEPAPTGPIPSTDSAKAFSYPIELQRVMFEAMIQFLQPDTSYFGNKSTIDVNGQGFKHLRLMLYEDVLVIEDPKTPEAADMVVERGFIKAWKPLIKKA